MITSCKERQDTSGLLLRLRRYSAFMLILDPHIFAQEPTYRSTLDEEIQFSFSATFACFKALGSKALFCQRKVSF